MSMSRKISDLERLERQKRRDDRAVEKENNPDLDKYALQILSILRNAGENSIVKYNSIYFEKLFDVSNITILRSIKKLKKRNLIQEKQTNGSYVINKSFDDDYYPAEIKKRIALVASVRGLLQQFKNTPIYNQVKDLILFLQPEIVKDDDVFSSGRVIVSPQMDYDINVRNWDKVYEAIHKNHKIRFRYLKPYTNNEAQRIVCPYQLVLDNGSVYLFAYSEYADNVLLYDLSYMTDIVVTPEEFDLPENYDINDYSGGGRLGAFKGDKTEKFKIRFTDYAKDWIKQHKWADDQTFTEDEDSTTITFTSSQFEKVLELTLSWGCQAEPLAPARLVKRWKAEIKAMYQKILKN